MYLEESDMAKQNESLCVASRALRAEYARRSALYEIRLYDKSDRPVEDIQAAKIREYSMSSPLRRHFMMRCIVGYLDHVYIEVGQTIELLGCSRAACDAMIKECLDANWITLEKNKQGYRRIQATEAVVECWFGYADYETELADEYDLNYLSTSAKKIRYLPDRR